MPTFRQRAQHRAVQEYRRARSRVLREPSYTYKHLEAVRIRRMMRELGVEDPVYAVNDKDDAHTWARRLGVRAPALLGRYADAQQIPWTSLPERCVVKPCHGSTSVGVFLLQRHAEAWRELQTGRLLTESDVVQQLGDAAAAGAVSSAVVVEELVTDPRFPNLPPVDYKVATFFGEVGMIEVKSHGWDGQGGSRSAWRTFDAQWRDIGNPVNEYNTDSSVPPPVHAAELLEMARTISAAVPRPFLRVDLFDDARGPVFGEITPEPGGPLDVRADVDRRLGRLWEEAEVRLRVRAARSGLLTPADAPLPEADLHRPPAQLLDGVEGAEQRV